MKTPENNTAAGAGSGESIHELLCAYLLGEADAETSAKVEAALEESAELRAERTRLEGTMGLVKGAFPTGEALSESAFADVLAQAEQVAQRSGSREAAATVSSPEPLGRPRFTLLSSNWIRAAAAVMVVGIGAWTWQRSSQGTETRVARLLDSYEEEAQVAQERARQDRREAAGEKNEATDRLAALGYVDADGAGKEQREQDAGSAPDAPAVEQLESLGYANAEPEAPAQLQLQARAEPKKAAESPAEVFAQAELVPGPTSVSPGVSGSPADEAQWREWWQANKEPYLNVKSRIHADSVETGADTFFLGRGERRAAEGKGSITVSGGEQSRASGQLADGAVGTYRGAGDTVPSGSAAMPPMNRWKKYSRRDTQAEAQPRANELRGLGYAGGDTEAMTVERPSAPPVWSAAEHQAWIDEQCRVRIVECYPRPKETPRAMYFRFWGDNQFQLTELDRLSTFSVDVDTASYALARRYLNEGHLPTKAQIRTEEFLNYFDPDLAAPNEGSFAIHTELAPSRFGGSTPRLMLRVGIRGREVPKEERKPLSLTFVVDTSGSMKENGRLELVKHAVRLLVGELDERDSIAIVAYSNEARVVLPLTPASQGGVIEAALYPLAPNGSTNAEAGLKLGYDVALAGLEAGKNHRVVFLSDGVANVGQTDQDRIAADVKRHLEAGIYLNTIGVGLNNHNDVFLEQLANKGDGVCDYVDSARAAQRAIVERFTGAFEPIASDVKVQVDFDPEQVHRYRLLGYENRAIADVDFRNDAVDAGEVGAGHQVVALYELELAKEASEAADAPLAAVRLRYKAPKVAGQDPNEVDVTELEHAIAIADAKKSFAEASPGYRRSVVVAQFAEFLRRSTHTYEDTFEALLAEAASLATELADPDFDEFLGLVKRAYQLGPPADYRGDLELTLDEFRRFQILRKELEALNRQLDGELLEELKRRNEELENKLRDLIRSELDKNG